MREKPTRYELVSKVDEILAKHKKRVNYEKFITKLLAKRK